MVAAAMLFDCINSGHFGGNQTRELFNDIAVIPVEKRCQTPQTTRHVGKKATPESYVHDVIGVVCVHSTNRKNSQHQPKNRGKKANIFGANTQYKE